MWLGAEGDVRDLPKHGCDVNRATRRMFYVALQHFVITCVFEPACVTSADERGHTHVFRNSPCSTGHVRPVRLA